MKMYFCRIALLILSLGVISSCIPKDNVKFHEEYSVVADSVFIGSVFDAVFMTQFGDYAVLASYNADTLLHFFQLPDANYSFGAVQRGSGPDEIKSMAVFCSGAPDFLYVKGYKGESIRKISVAQNQLRTVREFPIEVDGALNHMHIINDSLLYYNDIPGRRIRLYNMKNGAAESSTRYGIHDGRMTSSIDIDRGCFGLNSHTCLIAYQYRKEIDLFRTGDLKKTGSIKWEYDDQSEKMAGSPDDIVLYYTGIQSTEKAFYLLCQNTLPLDEQHPSCVEIYDREGNPMSRITLDRRIYLFCIDERHGLLFGKGESDDYIYRYKI